MVAVLLQVIRSLVKSNYCGGTSQTTTSSLLIELLLVITFTNFAPSKTATFENNMGHADGWTDEPTDGRTDRRTDTILIEIRSRI